MKAPAPIGRECLKADVTLPSHHSVAPDLLTAQLRISRSGQPRPTDARQRRTGSVSLVLNGRIVRAGGQPHARAEAVLFECAQLA